MGDPSNHDAQTNSEATSAERAAQQTIRAAVAKLNNGEVGPDDMIKVLDDFDQGLRALKTLYTERQFLQAKLQQREVDLLLRESELAKHAADLEELQSTIAAERAGLDSRREELARAEQRACEAERDAQRAVELAKSALDARSFELKAAEDRLSATVAQSEQRRRELDERAAAVESALVDIAHREAAMAESTGELRSLREQIKEADGKLSGLAARTADLQAELEREREAHAACRDQRDGTVAELARVRSEVESLGGQLSRARAELDRARAENERARTEHAQQIAAAEQRLTEQARAAEALVERLESAREERERGVAEAARLEERVRDAEQMTEEAVLRLKDEIEAKKTLAGETAAQRERMGELTRQVERLAAELQESQSAINERAPAFGPSRSEEMLARRRDRIRLAKRLLRDKVGRLRKGELALKKRFDQAEQILSQRAELAAAHTAIIQAQRKAQGQTARAKGGTAMLCVSAALAILGGLSWAISREVVPGVYAARTLVKAEGRGRELNSDELIEWQLFHEKLLKDPRLSDAIAQRMKRKNIAAMSEPAAVSARLREDFSSESAKNGEIVIELRGHGKEQTERELDTIATAFASEANASRAERLDGGATSVPSPASAGDEPIDNSRLVWAAGIMGGGSSILFVVGIAVWRRLKNAKTQFEQDVQLATILEASHWPDPRKAA